MDRRGLYISIGVLGLAVVALAVFTILKSNDSSSQIDDLQSSLTNVQDETSGENQAAFAEQGQKLDEQEEALELATRKLKKVENCLPEIQTEVNTMELERYGNEYFVSPGTQVSTYCSEVIYGPPDR